MMGANGVFAVSKDGYDIFATLLSSTLASAVVSHRGKSTSDRPAPYSFDILAKVHLHGDLTVPSF